MNERRSRVRLYTKRWCVYCVAAKRLFGRVGVPFEEQRVDHDPALRGLASTAVGGWPTLPMVFVGDTFIGGYSEARSQHARGRLRLLLEGAGPPGS